MRADRSRFAIGGGKSVFRLIRHGAILFVAIALFFWRKTKNAAPFAYSRGLLFLFADFVRCIFFFCGKKKKSCFLFFFFSFFFFFFFFFYLFLSPLKKKGPPPPPLRYWVLLRCTPPPNTSLNLSFSRFRLPIKRANGIAFSRPNHILRLPTATIS